MKSIKKIIKLLEANNTNLDFDSKGIYTFINPYSYSILRNNQVLEHFDQIFVDGISLVKVLELFQIKTNRVSFDMTSLAHKVFEKCISENRSIYFIGSTQVSIEKFIRTIRSKYSELNILGYRNGYFLSDEEKKQTVSDLIGKSPDVIIVGMGTPYQERFLIDLKKNGWIGNGFSCGGFIHQTAKRIEYYPNFFNKYNLRWLYRIIDEPKLISRYFITYPKSIFLFVFDMLSIKFQYLINEKSKS